MTLKEKNKFRKKINTAVFLAAVSLIISVLSGLGFYFLNKTITITMPLRMGFSTMFSMSVPLIIYRKIGEESKTAAKTNVYENQSRADELFFIMYGVFICMSLNFLTAFLKTGDTAGNAFGKDIIQWLLLFLCAGIMPAVMEELLFRRCILTSLKEYGEGFSIIFSALLFATIHSGFVNMVFAFLAGIVIGYIKIRTGKLYCCIAVHFINNLLTLLTAASGEFFSGQVQSSFFCCTGIISIIFSLLLLPFAVKKVKRLSPSPYSIGELILCTGGAALFPLYLLSLIVISL